MSAPDRPTEVRCATSNTGSRHRYMKPSATRFFVTFGYAWLTIGIFRVDIVKRVIASLPPQERRAAQMAH